MTAISAASATASREAANPFPAEIRLPGSDRTYEVRDVLRGMGLRWHPATHAWHGRLLAAQRAFLERRYGLVPRIAVPIEAFDPVQVASTLPPTRPRPPTGPRGPPQDFSRTRFEPRIAFPTLGDEPEEFRTVGRTFSIWETTSGLPDDSREADEESAERQLRELRARVKRARAVVSTTPGLADTLARDWQRAAQFYARLGITEAQLRQGVSADPADSDDGILGREVGGWRDGSGLGPNVYVGPWARVSSDPPKNRRCP